MRKRTYVPVVLSVSLALATVMLTNCTPSPATGATGSARNEIRVAIVPPGFTSPFHVAIKDGAVSEANKLGWKVDVVAAEREGDFAGQVAVVEQDHVQGQVVAGDGLHVPQDVVGGVLPVEVVPGAPAGRRGQVHSRLHLAPGALSPSFQQRDRVGASAHPQSLRVQRLTGS